MSETIINYQISTQSTRPKWGVAVDTAGNVYITNTDNDRVLKLPPQR